ncbi:hypothetical protein BD410DRAFT_280634 [Rickenella mellea]|uniref:Uncharacterized protein n=1 Tax=Rickenella mellea TaxID=50990 RepID=A0A4Y7Q2G4_9AGAM|nr:hypothetical protein BD410DRAFT_280634 [Rickenella mellea]
MLNLPERQEASSTSIFGFSMLLKHINIRIRWRNAIMGTAEALAAWRREYNAHPSTLRSNQRNWAILKLLAKLEGIKAFDFRVVFQRWLRAFSRSQTLINPSVWHHVRGDLLREVAEVAAAARAQLERENVPPANPNRVKCPHCPERKGRTFSVGDALSSHIKANVSVLGDSTNISVP